MTPSTVLSDDYVIALLVGGMGRITDVQIERAAAGLHESGGFDFVRRCPQWSRSSFAGEYSVYGASRPIFEAIAVDGQRIPIVGYPVDSSPRVA